MRVAKADLVPTETNLLGAYRTFGELETACRTFCDEVNDREHRETPSPPDRSAGRGTDPIASAAGKSVHRRVRNDTASALGCTVSVEGVRYSVTHTLVDMRVRVRFHGKELIVTAVDDHGSKGTRIARREGGEMRWATLMRERLFVVPRDGRIATGVLRKTTR